MLTINTDIDCFDAMKVMTICCEEVIEQQIIPELSLIYTLNISHYDDFLQYVRLIENVIKSAAIVQQLRHIQNNMQFDNPSKELLSEIKALKQQPLVATKYNRLFDYYFHDQPIINAFLTTSNSIYSHKTYIADLQYIIRLAEKGMAYTTQVAQYKIPGTYYCYTKKFNTEISFFLQHIIDDTFDTYNKKLYAKYDSLPISEEAFSSVITTIAFRLRLAIAFIEHFYTAQELIEEQNPATPGYIIDEYFIQFVGNSRHASLNS